MTSHHTHSRRLPRPATDDLVGGPGARHDTPPTPTSHDVTSNCIAATPHRRGTVAARHTTRPDVTSLPAAGGLQPASGPQQRVTPHQLTSRDVTSNCIAATPHRRGTVAARHTTRPDVTSHPTAGGLQPAGGPQQRVTPHDLTSRDVTSNCIAAAPHRRGLSQHVTPHDLTSHHPFQERCQS